jgi:hypothetical protein
MRCAICIMIVSLRSTFLRSPSTWPASSATSSDLKLSSVPYLIRPRIASRLKLGGYRCLYSPRNPRETV